MSSYGASQAAKDAEIAAQLERLARGGQDEGVSGAHVLAVELALAFEHEEDGEPPGRLGALVDGEELRRLGRQSQRRLERFQVQGVHRRIPAEPEVRVLGRDRKTPPLADDR